MKIKLTSVLVNDQAKALTFYTDVLEFVKKTEIPAINWITVASTEEPRAVELLLEPNINPAGKTFQEAIYKQVFRPRPLKSMIYSRSTSVWRSRASCSRTNRLKPVTS